MSPLRRARVGISSALDQPSVQRFDAASVRLAELGKGNAVVDRAAYALSEAANHSILWHVINLVDAVVGGPERRRAAVRRSVILGVEQAVVNGPLKMVARRERPETTEDHRHSLRSPVTSSFPSGHASAGACSATLMTRDLGRGWLWWTLAGLVAWSRVHVGVHHGSDIVAGAAVGRGLAVAACRVWPGPTTKSE